MSSTLGDGFLALRELAARPIDRAPYEGTSFREKLVQDLIYEAQKFFVYRAWKYRDRQSLSVTRLRCLRTMVREVGG